MTDSIDPKDFRSFSRTTAIDKFKMLQESQFDDDEIEPYVFENMTNDDMEEELCMSGVVHDSDMVGVYDTQQEADRALYAAQIGYNE